MFMFAALRMMFVWVSIVNGTPGEAPQQTLSPGWICHWGWDSQLFGHVYQSQILFNVA